MTNYKNKVKIKNLNDNSLPLFEGYKEDKAVKPATKLKNFNVESKPEKAKKKSSQTSSTVNKLLKKTVAIKSTKSKGSSLNQKTCTQDASLLHLSLGIYLQEARVKSGYSMSQVAMTTKLNLHYIEALERDDFKNTPPLIYVKAYVKKLSSLYEIDVAKALSLLKSSDNNKNKIVSESILQDLQETKQANKKDEDKIKAILKISAIVFSIIVFLGVISGLFFWFSGDDSDVSEKSLTASEKATMVKNMEKLIVPQSISLTELPFKPKK